MSLESEKKHIAILGSTGSIGTQALEVVSANPDLLQVEILTANKNADLLIKQAIKYKPNAVVIGEEKLYQQVKDALWGEGIKVYAGEKSLVSAMEMETVDMVLSAMVGFAGLLPTIRAIEFQKSIALANKETLVIAGDIVTSLAKEKGVNLFPVDSEHSAIFQCLAGEFHNKIEKIILTASGGPFKGKKREELKNVTAAQALKHPNWTMGAKITIDSASLMNKGLEVIEARWLFGLQADQIDVVIHPQSIIHSLVQFQDGSIKAQMGLPDMRLPIQYALTYPARVYADYPRFSFQNYPSLTFDKPDMSTFKNLALAFVAMEKGGNMPCILNAANEIAVEAFLKGQVDFLEMTEVIEKCMEKMTFINNPRLEDYVQTDIETRIKAKEIINE